MHQPCMQIKRYHSTSTRWSSTWCHVGIHPGRPSSEDTSHCHDLCHSQFPYTTFTSTMPQPQPPIGGKQMLLDKNTKLSAQVATQRKEINDLKDRLHNLENEEIKWKDTAACLTSVWDELNSSLGFLQFKYVAVCYGVSVTILPSLLTHVYSESMRVPRLHPLAWMRPLRKLFWRRRIHSWPNSFIDTCQTILWQPSRPRTS